MTDAGTTPKQRFLVQHDYGMGGCWWWVLARSPREILETFAEVEVVDDAAWVRQAESWELDEADVDGPSTPVGLDGLREKREAQRGRPGFGALADRSIVHLRRRWDGEDDEDPTVYLLEVGRDGRRLRQVRLPEDGTAFKSGPDDWALNPPIVDLFEPGLVDLEISRDEFEAQWGRARHDEFE
ncbi:hypothetical protein ACIRPT_04005 [Streptomyces sp. NPDC101227]|uniref:hypothetical protein n=1 Tax=Streptomyces sp. NPDC101227 TaxID=3366136 RepID=UPI00380B7DF6